MPLVSVIIPNYNHAQYLEQRITSVLNQTIQDFEVIILDDCSKDNSKDVIERFRKHPKIAHIVYNDINSGSTFKQWKKGIDLAKGEWIWIAESDDWCEITFLETVLSGVQKNENILISYVQSYCVDSNLNIKWNSRHSKLEETFKGVDFIKHFMITKNSLFNASMAIFKKEKFFLIDQEYLNYKLCGDWVFWVSLANFENSVVKMSGKVLNYFRKHNNDVSSKFYQTGNNFHEEIKALEYMLKNNIIDNSLFETALCNLYIRFKAYGRNFSTDNKKLILIKFFSGKNIRLNLIFKIRYFRYNLREKLRYRLNYL